MSGVKVVQELESKLKQGEDILDLKLLELDTLVCQNQCSGHGKCQEATRECICEPFWIENWVRRHLMDGRKNCGKEIRQRHFWLKNEICQYSNNLKIGIKKITK